MIKAIIFDRDGVIVDSESVNISSNEKAFRDLGITIDEEDRNFIVGRHPDDCKNYFLKKYDFSYEKLKRLQNKYYFESTDSFPLIEKSIELIKKLHKKNIPLALTTTSSLKNTLMVLKNANLENVFKVIVTFEDCSKRKPDPEGYLLTAKKLGLKPDECIVIEDTSIGLEAAKKAGMKCIIIPTKLTKNQDFSKADLVVESADKIINKIDAYLTTGI